MNGELIKTYRKRHHLTLKEVAKALDLSEGYISRLERGSSTPSFEVELKLQELLEIPVSELSEDVQKVLKTKERTVCELDKLLSSRETLYFKNQRLTNTDKKMLFAFLEGIIGGD